MLGTKEVKYARMTYLVDRYGLMHYTGRNMRAIPDYVMEDAKRFSFGTGSSLHDLSWYQTEQILLESGSIIITTNGGVWIKSLEHDNKSLENIKITIQKLYLSPTSRFEWLNYNGISQSGLISELINE